MESIITLTAVSDHCRRKCHGWEASIHDWQKRSPHDFAQGGVFQYVVMEEWESGIGLVASQELWFKIEAGSAAWVQIQKPKHLQGIFCFAFNV